MRNYYFFLIKTLSKSRQSILSLLILCAFVCATISHSAHSELIQDSVELQQCKLCQQSIDTPPENLTVKLASVSRYNALTIAIIIHYRESSAYLIPQLRAPPAQ
jgi:hypothetical protein